jgi:glycosyltransferase involved in cell wall biosynthesis
MSNDLNRPLRVVHVFRAPIGGLFRHVQDLVREQSARGCEIGIIADSLTGGDLAVEALNKLKPFLSLGLVRLPMHRQAHPGDALAIARVMRQLNKFEPDVVHGHGAKGGAYARMPGLFGDHRPVRAYTPHGGSFNYKPGTAAHAIYMAVEKALAPATDLLLFESAYIGGRYDAYVGASAALRRVIVNGVSEPEQQPVPPDADADDLLYVGELRSAKGIDTLLEALPTVAGALGRTPRLTLVGSGPDQEMLLEHARRLKLQDHVRFAGPMRARHAFRLGRILVTPSRAESLPYVVLEATSARVPIVATNVGGIPEIFGPFADRLIPCDHPFELAQAIYRKLYQSEAERTADAQALGDYVGAKFTLANMAEGVLQGYRDALALKKEVAQNVTISGTRG